MQNNNTTTFGAFGIILNGGNNHVVKNNFVSNINHNMAGGAAFSTTFGVFGISVNTGTGHKVYYNSGKPLWSDARDGDDQSPDRLLCLVALHRRVAMSETTSSPTTSLVEQRRLHTSRPTCLQAGHRR